jgi:hypothetical protein
MILIGANEGIYRWFDGCGWPIFHSLQDRAIVSLASPGAGLIAAIDRDGQVFESINNGQDWEVIPGPEGGAVPAMLDIWGEPSTIVLATKPLGLYRRVIGAPLPRQASNTARVGLAPALIGRARSLAEGAATRLAPRRRIAPAGPSTVWRALGKPEVAKGKVASAAVVRALAVGGGMPAPWFAAIRGAGLWRSLDEGSTWQQCPGLPDEVLAIRTAPHTPGSVVAATADGCRFSTDGGQTWEDRSVGLENARYVGAIEVKPDNPDILLAGAAPAPGQRFALYESTNGGKAWMQVKRGFPEDIVNDVITDIRYDPAATDNVIVALGSGELWLSRFDRAYWCPLARQINASRVLCAAD